MDETVTFAFDGTENAGSKAVTGALTSPAKNTRSSDSTQHKVEAFIYINYILDFS